MSNYFDKDLLKMSISFLLIISISIVVILIVKAREEKMSPRPVVAFLL